MMGQADEHQVGSGNHAIGVLARDVALPMRYCCRPVKWVKSDARITSDGEALRTGEYYKKGHRTILFIAPRTNEH